MGKILVKTNYNWADEIDFPSWEVWDEKEFEEAKEKIKTYWENDGESFEVCVGTNEEIDFNDVDDCLKYGIEGTTPITDEEFSVLKKLFGGRGGNVTFSRVMEYIERD